MFKKFFNNTRKPSSSFGGRMMLSMMNKGHDPMARWGLDFLKECWPLLQAGADEVVGAEGSAGPVLAKGSFDAIDLGCGGGRNLQHLLGMTSGQVYGLDYSEASIERSTAENREALDSGRLQLFNCSVAEIPLEDESVDLATAFETIYFWPGLVDCFREVWRVLRPGGAFLIVNECTEPKQSEVWTKIIEGMRVYEVEEIRAALLAAGFPEAGFKLCEKRNWKAFVVRK